MDVNDTILNFFVKYNFELFMPSCKSGKEGIYMALDSLVKKQESNLFICRWTKNYTNESIELGYSNMPFGNLRFIENLSIKDNAIAFSYMEKTNQKLMLPNLLFFVNMLLLAIKTAEILNDGFDKHSINCHIMMENNGECYFYEKYSPLIVDYSKMLKYSVDSVVDFRFDIEGEGDVYLLVNRFYQQFKCPQSMAKPFVTIVKDNFWQFYGRL